MDHPAADISFDAHLLRDPSRAFAREWLDTNGIGGYAAATLGGANTRRYHGLLVAALNPPAGRAVLLSRIEERLVFVSPGGTVVGDYSLSASFFPGVISPEGYRTLDSWESLPAPKWVWRPAENVAIEKTVWMQHGQNRVMISYRLLEAPPNCAARLELTPLAAWRDFHSEMRACDPPPVEWLDAVEGEPAMLRFTLPVIEKVTVEPTRLELRLVRMDGSPAPHTAFHAHPDWYYRFQHPRELERGLEGEEDLFTPGTCVLPLNAGEERVVGATASAASSAPVEAVAPQTTWDDRIERQSRLMLKVGMEDAFTRRLALAAQSFIVEAAGRRTSIIAGYPWFADWGRDTMIALPGLCLATGRPELAREILLSFAEWVDGGMLPNRFPDVGETPEYNTIDATLWYFVAIWRYLEATDDIALLRDRLWPVLVDIVKAHFAGTRYNIHVDPADGLLYGGQEGVQLTWMDAKVGDWVVTPRIGKPVEINALWVNALRTMASLAGRIRKSAAATEFAGQAERAAASFVARYPRPDGLGLYDVLDTPSGSPDSAIRPNQVFALSLPFAPIDAKSAEAEGILRIVHSELWTYFGLRTLAPTDPAYHGRYGGDPLSRDGAYHQGTVWPWLLGPFVEAHFRVHDDRADALALLQPLMEQMTEFGVGSIAEVYDGDMPQRPNGCPAQAWSIGETLRVWKRLLTAGDNG